MVSFDYKTPLGTLDLRFYHETSVGIGLAQFEFDDQDFYSFQVQFTQDGVGVWQLEYLYGTLNHGRSLRKNSKIGNRLAEVIRDLFLQWWAINRAEVPKGLLQETKEQLLEEIRYIERRIVGDQACLDEAHNNLDGVCKQLAAAEQQVEEPTAGEDIVGQLLGA